MKIELTEEEIAQAIVNWLSDIGLIKDHGPYDVKFDAQEGKITAFVQPKSKKQ